jgi:SAM-dependent methyltransferase
MNSQRKTDSFYDHRERYEQTPDRYNEIASNKSVRTLLISLGKEWKKNLQAINYVDVGCSGGKGTQEFALFLKEITGLSVKVAGADVSKECKLSCESKGIDFSCIDFNSEALPFRDCQVITVFETIEHIFNTDFLIESVHQCLSKDGILLITTLNVVCWKNRILVPLGIQPFNTEVSMNKLSYGYRINSLRRRIDLWKPAGHIRPFTLYSLCDLLQDNGFRIVKSFGLENWASFKILEKLSKNMCTGMLVIAKPA